MEHGPSECRARDRNGGRRGNVIEKFRKRISCRGEHAGSGLASGTAKESQRFRINQVERLRGSRTRNIRRSLCTRPLRGPGPKTTRRKPNGDSIGRGRRANRWPRKRKPAQGTRRKREREREEPKRRRTNAARPRYSSYD